MPLVIHVILLSLKSRKSVVAGVEEKPSSHLFFAFDKLVLPLGNAAHNVHMLTLLQKKMGRAREKPPVNAKNKYELPHIDR